MAYGKEFHRRALAEEVGRRLGVTLSHERIFQSQVLAGPEAAMLASLPVDESDFAPLQDSSGNLYFMPDFDPVDSPDFVLL
jgi:hypothetical protein